MAWTTPRRSDTAGGLAVHRVGKGPPLLLVHGVGLCAEFWAGLVPALTGRFATSAVDLPGHGRSAPLKSARPALADYAAAVGEALPDSEPAIVVGHSLGALVALELAVRVPERVAGIAVLNGVYRRDARALGAVRARAAGLDGTHPADPSATLARWFGTAPSAPEAAAARACERWLLEVDPGGYRDAYRAFAHADAPADEALTGIRCPALFVTGELEPNSTPAMSRAMSDLVPDARCHVVDGARHMLPMTHGAELASALLGRFTSEVHDDAVR